MGIREIIDWSNLITPGSISGTIASDFYEYYDPSGNYMWACDVDIGQQMLSVDAYGNPTTTTVLTNVPVPSNNWELLYAQQGQAVTLEFQNGRWVITGLSKTTQGLGHIIFLTFSDDVATVVRDDWYGYITRPLTFGELGSLADGGFGTLPFGCQGRFTKSGVLVEII
jgi:hypothetical protein